MRQRDYLAVRALGSLRPSDVAGKPVLVRVDYNVLDDQGNIVSDLRLRASVPTVRRLAKELRARVVLISHAGRPQALIQKRAEAEGGNADQIRREVFSALSMRPVAGRLAAILREEGVADGVGFVPDCGGPGVRRAVADLAPGDVILLENCRFPISSLDTGKSRDEMGDPALARAMVEDTGAAAYVLDGFSVCHRDHASVTGLARELKHLEPTAPSVAGALLQRELEVLFRDLGEDVQRPYVAVVGGAKVSGKAGKLGLLRALAGRADMIVVGGAMLYPFLLAQGFTVGADPLGRDAMEARADLEAAAALLEEAGKRICLPTGIVVEDCGQVARLDVRTDVCPPEARLRDIQPEAIERILDELGRVGAVVWNGPVGKFEDPRFAAGTGALVRRMMTLTQETGTTTVAGGGDCEAFLRAHAPGALTALSHVSTGGGAMLAALAGHRLAGVEALDPR